MTWTMPVLAVSAFKQDAKYPHIFWYIGKPPEEDFEFDYTAGGQNVVMTPKRAWEYNGVRVYEWRAAYWIDYDEFRAKLIIRFVW